jgi:hypothetical protein
LARTDKTARILDGAVEQLGAEEYFGRFDNGADKGEKRQGENRELDGQRAALIGEKARAPLGAAAK